MPDIPATTTNAPIVVWPRIVQHCNARTGYQMYAHWFNPVECYECADILTHIGNVVPD